MMIVPISLMIFQYDGDYVVVEECLKVKALHIIGLGLLTIIRLWLGIQWFIAGIGKYINGFDAQPFLEGALAKSTGEDALVSSWYATWIEQLALPNVGLINALIPFAELVVGILLILSLLTVPALVVGSIMNLNYLLAGTIALNPVFLAASIALLAAGRFAYQIGIDHWIIRWYRSSQQPHPLDRIPV